MNPLQTSLISKSNRNPTIKTIEIKLNTSKTKNKTYLK